MGGEKLCDLITEDEDDGQSFTYQLLSYKPQHTGRERWGREREGGDGKGRYREIDRNRERERETKIDRFKKREINVDQISIDI